MKCPIGSENHVFLDVSGNRAKIVVKLRGLRFLEDLGQLRAAGGHPHRAPDGRDDRHPSELRNGSLSRRRCDVRCLQHRISSADEK